MTTAANKSAAIFSATIAGAVTLLVSFWLFRSASIQLWEWQHGGRRIVFVFDPDIKAAVVASSLSIVVFFVFLWRSLRAKQV